MLLRAVTNWFTNPSAALERETYRRLRNVVVETPLGTVRIEQLIVSRSGIFVIQTKSMHGWVYGQEDAAYWLQFFDRYRLPFPNPLKTNRHHIHALSQFLDLPLKTFHSVVCFLGDSCHVKSRLPSNVIQGKPNRYVRSKVRSFLSEEQVDRVVGAIKRAHRQHARAAHLAMYGPVVSERRTHSAAPFPANSHPSKSHAVQTTAKKNPDRRKTVGG